ncbi:MAG: cupin domain-containing protein [Anaerolineae bacterium]|nr:cupin domain-containing protein [Phycisphaerae bacterium]
MSDDRPQSSGGDAEPIGLIGGIGLTEVHVYAQRAAPDGLFSGCPHVHAVTDEAYFVLQGSGAVEFHDLDNGYRRLPLETGQYVHFPPLVMHRLISDGDLVILGMMGNAGLAERGEARIYFGRDVDEDPKRFEELQTLPMRLDLEGALQRRDAAVRAYQHLMNLWATNRLLYRGELERFFEVHQRAMATIAGMLLEQVKQGPLAWGRLTQERIESLSRPSASTTNVSVNRRTAGDSALGMCGVLRPILTLEKLRS